MPQTGHPGPVIDLEPAPAQDWWPTSERMNRCELRLFGILRRLGTPVVPQARVGPWRVDFLLPDLRVVVEADSRRYHAAREDATRDRARDADLQALGFVVIHVWSDVLYRREIEPALAKIRNHVRLRVYRARGVWLGGPGSRRQFERYVGFWDPRAAILPQGPGPDPPGAAGCATA